MSSRRTHRLPQHLLGTVGRSHWLAPTHSKLPITLLHALEMAPTQQHHEVTKLQRCPLPSPGPLHLGHTGSTALQLCKFLFTGGWSVNIHMAHWASAHCPLTISIYRSSLLFLSHTAARVPQATTDQRLHGIRLSPTYLSSSSKSSRTVMAATMAMV